LLRDFTNSLHLFSKTLDRQYTILRDVYGSNVALYVEEQNIYVPNCVLVKEVKVESQPKYCYQ